MQKFLPICCHFFLSQVINFKAYSLFYNFIIKITNKQKMHLFVFLIVEKNSQIFTQFVHIDEYMQTETDTVEYKQCSMGLNTYVKISCVLFWREMKCHCQ